ncbi:hypothetical protein [Paenibacillus woosongensis]|uniref:hypothetical protein n=1 Tax=Paenibacillus woosongensis TaxID=307580 RepID=UPI003D31AC42
MNMANETILLVDDEEEIIAFIQDALELEGYRVLTAGNGRDALIQSKQTASGIRLKADGFNGASKLPSSR